MDIEMDRYVVQPEGIRTCRECGKPVIRVSGPSGSRSVEFLPGTTKIQGSRRYPHCYACDECAAKTI